MNPKKLDILNIFLIIVSLILAFILPFELFLFSYAVLGPLHYATEINWLDNKNYFILNKKWIYLIIFLCFIVSIKSLLNLPLFSFLKEVPFFKWTIDSISKINKHITLLAFLLAIGLGYIEKTKTLIIYSLFCIVIANFILTGFPFSIIVVGIFLPTVIHVYLFTVLFMIYGTLNSKNKYGITAITLAILAPLLIAFYPLNLNAYRFSDEVTKFYFTSGIQNLNLNLIKLFDPQQIRSSNLVSVIGIKIQIFIAFAYTYHYLNWFSKTSTIGWNKNLSKPKIMAILSVWIGSMLLYVYNYRIGLSALFFFSLLHVFLEFPLNITTIKMITKKILLPAK
jgi:hypothetical protein